MKIFLCAVIVACASAYGVDQCSWGPSHWCSSLKNAKQCGAVKHCIGTVWSNSEPSNDKSDVCGFCENIIKDVKGFVTDNQTEAMVRDYMDSACALIPVKELADACKEALDDDIDVFFDLLKTELNGKVICTTIGLCSGFSDFTIHEQAKKQVPVVKINDVAEPKGISDLCPECKAIINTFSNLVADNETIVHVDSILKSELCAQLGALKDECEDLVTQYVPQIVEAISQAINADQICGALGMCPNGDLLMLVKMKLKTSPLYRALTAAQVSTSEECMFCKIVFEELQQLDRNAAVQKEVEDFINSNLCSKLGSYQAVCESTVTEYGQMLFELLATELDPATRCSSIGFCASPGISKLTSSQIIRNAMPLSPVKITKPSPKAAKSVEGSEGCLICQTVMMEIKNMLESNSTEAQLVKQLEEVCSILPDTIKAQCTAFVDAYGPAVIEMLLQELDPQTVCTALGLCSKSKEQTKKVMNAESGAMCGVCETVIQYLDSILVQNATEEEIKKDLERICNFLPDTIKETCDTMVEQYALTIIQLVAQGLTPEEVCQELGLCSATNLLQNALLNDAPIVPVKAQMVGLNECTYGPSFWCASKENAARCKAMDHCNEKVWNK